MRFIKTQFDGIYNLDYVKYFKVSNHTSTGDGGMIHTPTIFMVTDDWKVVVLHHFETMEKAKERLSAIYDLINWKKS